MNLRRIHRLSFASSLVLAGSLAGAQPASFVHVESIPLGPSAAKAGEGEIKLGRGIMRRAPIDMETSAQFHADGSVSTTCAAVQSDVPHAVEAAHAVGKLPQRER